MVLIWLNKAVKFLSILRNTLWTHRCSAFTKDLPVNKIRVAHLCSALCSPIMCLDVLGSCCDFRIQTMVGSSLPPVVCKRAHVLLTLSVFFADSSVLRTLCWVFVFCFCFYSLSCVTCVASFYGLSILCYHFSIL